MKMSIPQIVLSVVVLLTSLFLIAVVLLQSGKGSSADARLARMTKWVGFVFMLAVLVLNLL